MISPQLPPNFSLKGKLFRFASFCILSSGSVNELNNNSFKANWRLTLCNLVLWAFVFRILDL